MAFVSDLRAVSKVGDGIPEMKRTDICRCINVIAICGHVPSWHIKQWLQS